MNISKIFLNEYQSHNPEKFNKDILECRKREDIPRLIRDIFKGMEIIEGIKLISFETILLNTPNPLELDLEGKIEREINIEISKFYKIITKFELTGKNKVGKIETLEREIRFYVPELIDGKFFTISGNNFFPVFQIVDSEYYRTKSYVVVKTLNQPLPMLFINTKLTSVDKSFDIETKKLELSLFSYKVFPFFYYFAKFGGVTKGLEFFGLEDIVSVQDGVSKNKDEYSFLIKDNNHMIVKKSFLDANPKDNAPIIKTLLETFVSASTASRKPLLENLEDPIYWKKKHGQEYLASKNSNADESKSKKILLSFERIADLNTQRIMRVDIDDKKDTYSIVRWMMINYNELLKLDNSDIVNKRIRLAECMLYDFVEKITSNIFRLITSNSITTDKLESVFKKIKEEFIIKSINSDKNSLMRYDNSVNTIDLFSSTLKGSNSGFEMSSFI